MSDINLKNVKLMLDNEHIVGNKIIRRILGEIEGEEYRRKTLNDTLTQEWEQWTQWDRWDQGAEWEKVSAPPKPHTKTT
jgi:hypothetical protein